MQENGLEELWKFIGGQKIDYANIRHTDIKELRSKLGAKVLKELPRLSPRTTSEYDIPVHDHSQVEILLRSPIAVGESINGIQADFPIWGGDDFVDIIRRNIQYSQYLNPEFYCKAILHVLNKS